VLVEGFRGCWKIEGLEGAVGQPVDMGHPLGVEVEIRKAPRIALRPEERERSGR
jgi:hypothetical protein